MQMQEIEITILPDGRVEYTIKGVKGSACESISTLLEQLGKVELEQRTGEYYEQESDAHITTSLS
jgi:predicted transcriptional regulator